MTSSTYVYLADALVPLDLQFYRNSSGQQRLVALVETAA